MFCDSFSEICCFQQVNNFYPYIVDINMKYIHKSLKTAHFVLIGDDLISPEDS